MCGFYTIAYLCRTSSEIVGSHNTTHGVSVFLPRALPVFVGAACVPFQPWTFSFATYSLCRRLLTGKL